MWVNILGPSKGSPIDYTTLLRDLHFSHPFEGPGPRHLILPVLDAASPKRSLHWGRSLHLLSAALSASGAESDAQVVWGLGMSVWSGWKGRRVVRGSHVGVVSFGPWNRARRLPPRFGTLTATCDCEGMKPGMRSEMDRCFFLPPGFFNSPASIPCEVLGLGL